MTHIGRYDERHAVLERVSIVKWTDAYKFTERVYADKAKWWGDHWLLYGVNLTRRADNGRFVVQALPTMHAAIDKPPSEFGRVELVAKEMNLFQLGRYIEKLQEEGQSADKYLVDWYDKTAFPFVCLIMAALSVPFAIRINPRFGGMALGLGVSIVAAFSYWIVHTAFIALGHGGYLPPMLAAYGANIVFGLGAGILLLQAGT
jgi:lipopolysaccharide export system permease protein